MAQRRTGTARDWMITEDWPQGPLNEDAHPLTGQYSPGEMFTTPGGIFTTGNPIPHSAKAAGIGSYGAPSYGAVRDYYEPPGFGTPDWPFIVRLMERGLWPPRGPVPMSWAYNPSIADLWRRYGAPESAGAAPPRPSQMTFQGG